MLLHSLGVILVPQQPDVPRSALRIDDRKLSCALRRRAEGRCDGVCAVAAATMRFGGSICLSLLYVSTCLAAHLCIWQTCLAFFVGVRNAAQLAHCCARPARRSCLMSIKSMSAGSPALLYAVALATTKRQTRLAAARATEAWPASQVPVLADLWIRECLLAAAVGKHASARSQRPVTPAPPCSDSEQDASEASQGWYSSTVLACCCRQHAHSCGAAPPALFPENHECYLCLPLAAWGTSF